MEKFEKLKSTITPLNIENIDTDQIIPARFLIANSVLFAGIKTSAPAFFNALVVSSPIPE